tara:strand:- start:53620 stop:53892 length:273 start_codon:yes stop_codon:yes gene_type:complete
MKCKIVFHSLEVIFRPVSVHIGTRQGTNQYHIIMLNTVTQFGELVEVNCTNGKSLGCKIIVNKFVDGQLRSSYPVDSHGRAKLLMKSIVA